MTLDALRKFRNRVAVCGKGARGPSVVGSHLRLVGVRQPVMSSNQMRASSHVIPELSFVDGVKVMLFQNEKISCRKSAFVCHFRWQLISLVVVSWKVVCGLLGSA